MTERIKGVMVIMRCTEATETGVPNTIEPLAKHLHEGHDFTGDVRKWTITLLAPNDDAKYCLQYKARQGVPSATRDIDPLGFGCEAVRLHKRLTTNDFCTALADYLRDGGELSPFLREWLVRLLKQDALLGHSLHYKYRKVGNRRSAQGLDKEIAIDARVKELRGQIITHDFCAQLKRIKTLGYQKDDVPTPYPFVYRFGSEVWEKDRFGSLKIVKVNLHLKIGKVLNESQIYKIAASEHDMSVSTVKRVLTEIEATHYLE